MAGDTLLSPSVPSSGTNGVSIPVGCTGAAAASSPENPARRSPSEAAAEALLLEVGGSWGRGGRAGGLGSSHAWAEQLRCGLCGAFWLWGRPRPVHGSDGRSLFYLCGSTRALLVPCTDGDVVPALVGALAVCHGGEGCA